MVQAGFKKGAKLERWEKALNNPAAALKQIGALMVSESQAAFRAQKFGTHKWAERAVPNIYGIISDLHKGGEVQSRRFESRPALVDTGALKGAGGIVFKVSGKTVTVGVSPSQSYAKVLHTGGKIESLPVTQTIRDRLAEFLRSGKGRPWRQNLGFLFNLRVGETLKGEVEARPFIGITKQTLEDAEEAIGVKIFEVK